MSEELEKVYTSFLNNQVSPKHCSFLNGQVYPVQPTVQLVSLTYVDLTHQLSQQPGQSNFLNNQVSQSSFFNNQSQSSFLKN